MSKTRDKITIVFDVVNREEMKAYYEAHMAKNATVFGLIPNILAWGDQVTKPSEIVCALAELNENFDKSEIKELILEANKHVRGE